MILTNTLHEGGCPGSPGRFTMNRKTRELLNIILIINIIYAIAVIFIGKIEDSQFRIFIFAILYLMLPIVNILLVLAIYMSQNVIIIEKKIEEPVLLEPNNIDILTAIREIILSKGERFPKKHGSWICLKLDTGFFSMDSWNGAIHYHDGEPIYEYWAGFSGSSNVYLGLSDKSWRHNDPLPLTKEQYLDYLNKLNLFLNEHIKKELNEGL
jgi:hypothetical protein